MYLMTHYEPIIAPTFVTTNKQTLLVRQLLVTLSYSFSFLLFHKILNIECNKLVYLVGYVRVVIKIAKISKHTEHSTGHRSVALNKREKV